MLVLSPRLLGLVACLALAASGGHSPGRAQDATAPSLSLPIACEPGKTCFLQSHVDLDSGPGARDFACGSATYDGHSGTDFRVVSLAGAREGKFAVLAAADGTVKGGRDGMEDRPVDGPQPDIASRECGNGVVLDHGSGWETQYCHLMKGSVTAKPGQAIKRGETLGLVGASGLAEFAHVHLSVRKDGKVIDPFSGAEPGTGACSPPSAEAAGLWTEDARKAFPYVNGEIIGTGFTSERPARAALELDHNASPPKPGDPMVYFYARVANIRVGDVMRMTLLGPGGFRIESASKPLDISRQMHIEWAFAKTGKGGPLPAGSYSGKAELVRGGNVISVKEGAFELGAR